MLRHTAPASSVVVKEDGWHCLAIEIRSLGRRANPQRGERTLMVRVQPHAQQELAERI